MPGEQCEHNWQGGKKQQKCANCGATCLRDDRGVIVDYDRVPGQYIEGVVDKKAN